MKRSVPEHRQGEKSGSVMSPGSWQIRHIGRMSVPATEPSRDMNFFFCGSGVRFALPMVWMLAMVMLELPSWAKGSGASFIFIWLLLSAKKVDAESKDSIQRLLPYNTKYLKVFIPWINDQGIISFCPFWLSTLYSLQLYFLTARTMTSYFAYMHTLYSNNQVLSNKTGCWPCDLDQDSNATRSFFQTLLPQTHPVSLLELFLFDMSK